MGELDPAVRGATGQDAVDALVRLLDLEQIEENIFRGVSPDDHWQRVFGGQVAGQALLAAGRTVPADRHVHSLHSYFIRPGDPTIPIVYEVDRTRDGRSFTTRRVVAVQRGKTIFSLSASFQIVEDGYDHQSTMPDVPAPETVPTFADALPASGIAHDFHSWRARPIELRYITDPPWTRPAAVPTAESLVWLRAAGQLPDDPLLHVCVLTFASDMTLLDVVQAQHNMPYAPGSGAVASLDHAMWFERPFRADDWLLYVATTPSASGGRGLASGRFFTRDGVQVCSVVQEGLIRPAR